MAALARQIPGARMETIPVGHLIHDADPEAFDPNGPEIPQWTVSPTGTIAQRHREHELYATASTGFSPR